MDCRQLTVNFKVYSAFCPVLFLFGVLLGSLPLALDAGSCGGCVHWTPPFLVDLVYHILASKSKCNNIHLLYLSSAEGVPLCFKCASYYSCDTFCDILAQRGNLLAYIGMQLTIYVIWCLRHRINIFYQNAKNSLKCSL
jgi:hypothetical protein